MKYTLPFNNFLITKGSIHGIINTVKKFRYCKGIQDSENVALNEQDFVKEVWSKSIALPQTLTDHFKLILNLISAINLFPFRISPVNMPTVIDILLGEWGRASKIK
jgi:hypothetical protein